jgi:predicted phage terminase large subunit-like protein
MGLDKIILTDEYLQDAILNEEFALELKRNIYSKSYYEFFKAFFPTISGGDQYNDNWHIEYICNRLQQELERIKNRRAREKDIIINVPFRSSKSLMVTVAFPVWCWIERPATKFICTSYSASLSLEHAELSRTLINSEEFQKLYGDRVKFLNDENQKGFYKIKGGGYRKSVDMGGQITGSGSDFIIVDDPQNPNMSASEVERENVKSFYDNTLYSRLNQPELGVRIVIMQRLHEEDLSGYLVSKAPQKHEHICIPVEVDRSNMDNENLTPKTLLKYYDGKGLFWPTRFSKRVINDFTESLGSKEAAGQLYQRPAPKEGNMVKEAWFEIVNPATITRDIREHPMNFYIDTAETEKQENDYSAICAGFKKDGIVYICNIFKYKKEFVNNVKFIPEWCIANGYTKWSMIKLEPKSSGNSIVAQIRASTGLNIGTLESPKDDKVTRLSAITPICESGRVKFLAGNYIKPFMQSLTVFPNGKHDDDVDTFVYCVADLLGGNQFDFMF